MTPEEQTLLARMDERLEFIQGKVSSFCEFKDGAAIDITTLKNHCENTKDLPGRVASLELKYAALFGGLILVAALIGWDWLKVGAI